ncbi:3-keto-disaccharide hydrolase [Actinophytocola sediminis]
MRRWLPLVLLLAACSSPSTAPSCDEDPIELFDGSLAGWSQAGPGGFEVVDGVLRSEGGMGLLWYSARAFDDFDLRLDWRVSAETDNSGVFLRFPDPGDDPGVAVASGYEVQINDNREGDPQKTGAIYGVRPPSAAASHPVGSWNSYRILATGQRYQVWLNDTLVNDLTGTDENRGTTGHLGLQNHDPASRVEFRAISLTCSN